MTEIKGCTHRKRQEMQRIAQKETRNAEKMTESRRRSDVQGYDQTRVGHREANVRLEEQNDKI